MSALGETTRRELAGKPVPIELVLFGGGILCVTPFANKLMVELLALLSVAFLGVGLLKHSGSWLRFWRITSMLWVLVLFSPLDIALRSAESSSIRWVRVIYGTDTSSTVRRIQTEGWVSNRDYVSYSGSSLLIPCRRALLLTLATTAEIKTPVFSFLKDAPTER